jgi:hypothetical protein
MERRAMNQMDLFDGLPKETDKDEADSFPIRSGRIGPIRFGATETSYALTEDVLTALAAQADDVDKGPS